MMTQRSPYTFDRVTRMVITAIVIVGVLFLINKLKMVLLPFCVATLVAYILEPFVQYNRKLLKLKGRVVAVLLTLFETLLVLCFLCCIFMPRIIEEFHEMAVIFQNYTATAQPIALLPDWIHEFIQRNINFEHLAKVMTEQQSITLLEGMLDTSWGIITGSLSLIMGIFSWLVVLLYVVFIMIDYERLNVMFRRMIPPRHRKTMFKIGNDVKRSMNHYFRGQALISFIVGTLFAIGFTIVGLPLAIPLGLFIGLLNMVPYLQLISFVPTALLCLVYAAGGEGHFWTIFFECLAVYGIVQAIQDLFLTPKIMGRAMGLNPAIILLSLSVWGTLLGFIGLIIALPLTTLLLSYYKQYVIDRHEDDRTPREKEREIMAIDRATLYPDDPQANEERGDNRRD